MSDKKPFKVDLATVTLVAVLLIAFIVILFCLISKFYNKMQIATDKVATLNDKIEVISTEKTPVVIESLDINSELIRRLFDIVEMHNFSTEIENFHREGAITVNELDNTAKLLTIFNECFIRGLSVTNPDINGWGDIYKKDVEEVAKEIFGEDVKLDYVDILDMGLEFTYDENEEKYITEINSKTGGVLPNVDDIYEVLYAEKIDNKVYVYNRYARVYGRAYMKNDPVGIYGSSDKKIVIDDKISRDDLTDLLSRYFVEGPLYSLEEEMFSLRSQYRDSIPTYRHEFELNSDGTTYKWLSSSKAY